MWTGKHQPFPAISVCCRASLRNSRNSHTPRMVVAFPKSVSKGLPTNLKLWNSGALPFLPDAAPKSFCGELHRFAASVSELFKLIYLWDRESFLFLSKRHPRFRTESSASRAQVSSYRGSWNKSSFTAGRALYTLRPASVSKHTRFVLFPCSEEETDPTRLSTQVLALDAPVQSGQVCRAELAAAVVAGSR